MGRGIGLGRVDDMTHAHAAPYTKERAKAHDAELAAATVACRKAQGRRESAMSSGHRLVGDRKDHWVRNSRWGLDESEVRQRLGLLAEAGGGDSAAAKRVLAAVSAADREIATITEEVDRLDRIWQDRGRWSRFFMVAGGHIHRSTGCHTLRPTTFVGWLPELSGESEGEAVAAHGAVLCTHCFPSAPTEWTTKAPRPADPDACAGSGRYVPDAQHRYRSARGNCPECGQSVSVTTLGKARKHKKAADSGPAA